MNICVYTWMHMHIYTLACPTYWVHLVCSDIHVSQANYFVLNNLCTPYHYHFPSLEVTDFFPLSAATDLFFEMWNQEGFFFSMWLVSACCLHASLVQANILLRFHGLVFRVISVEHYLEADILVLWIVTICLPPFLWFSLSLQYSCYRANISVRTGHHTVFDTWIQGIFILLTLYSLLPTLLTSGNVSPCPKYIVYSLAYVTHQIWLIMLIHILMNQQGHYKPTTTWKTDFPLQAANNCQ